jgi:hypothetical protein
MIRINRLVKKSALYRALDLPHVAKIELVRRKANQKDHSVIRVCIYLTRSHTGNERGEFNGVIGSMLIHPNLSNEAYCTLRNALNDGFIKESTYNKLGIPLDKRYSELCAKYNQEFFDKL